VASAGTSKTPPELIGAIFELGKLLLHVAEHWIFHLAPESAAPELSLCHKVNRRLMGR
jgi:hypothetical protein